MSDVLTSVLIATLWFVFMAGATWAWYKAEQAEARVNRKIDALNEAILLFNDGAHEEAVGLLRASGMTVVKKHERNHP